MDVLCVNLVCSRIRQSSATYARQWTEEVRVDMMLDHFLDYLDVN